MLIDISEGQFVDPGKVLTIIVAVRNGGYVIDLRINSWDSILMLTCISLQEANVGAEMIASKINAALEKEPHP